MAGTTGRTTADPSRGKAILKELIVTPQTEEKLWTRNFGTILVSHFIFYLGFYMLTPTLPLYIRSLGGGAEQIGLVTTGYAMASVIMRFAVPFLQEKYSRMVLLRIGIVAALALAVVYCFIRSMEGVVLIRLLQGMGFGLVTTFAGAMAADAVPTTRLGEGISLFGMATTGAVAFSPALGLLVMNRFGFTPMFVAAAAVISVSAVTWSTVSLPEPPRAPAAAEGKLSFWSRIYDTRIALQTVLLICFGVARGSLQSFLTVMADEEGLSMITVYFIVETGVTFAFRFVSRKWYDRRGPGSLVLLGGLMSAFSFYLFSVTRSNALLLSAAVSNGIALGAIVPTFQAWIMEEVGAQHRTLGSALYFNISDFGTAAGAAVMGVVASHTGYHGAFRVVMFVMLAYVAIYLVWTHGRKRRADGERRGSGLKGN